MGASQKPLLWQRGSSRGKVHKFCYIAAESTPQDRLTAVASINIESTALFTKHGQITVAPHKDAASADLRTKCEDALQISILFGKPTNNNDPQHFTVSADSFEPHYQAARAEAACLLISDFLFLAAQGERAPGRSRLIL